MECVPNVSEGRRAEVIDRLAGAVATAAGCCLLDVHSDVDHNRSVFTFAGDPGAAQAGALALAAIAVELVDMRRQDGVHPRFGAVDVIPFVPLQGLDMAACVELARDTARLLAEARALPVYLFAEAAAPGRPDRLADIRRGGFEALIGGRSALRPDFGPQTAHPTAGAVCVGARDGLVAFNLLLDSREVSVARRVAAMVRESGNGLSGVQAIGLYLPSRDHAQVSMNLLDTDTTPVAAAVDAVRRAAGLLGARVVEAELVDLAPRTALEDLPADIPGMPGVEASIESRLEGCGR